MKRLSLWLAVIALATTTSAIAQQTEVRTNLKRLDKIATAAAKDYKANRAKALKLAKAQGWVIEKTYKDGSRISLQGLDTQGMPIYYITYNNARAAATVGTDQLWAGGSLGLTLSGSGSAVANKLGLWDGGQVRETHQELVGRVDQKDKPAQIDDHATHVAGTMIAAGVNKVARGMAYGNKMLAAYDYNSDVSEMAKAAKDLLISNHSYGTITGWRYNSDRKGTATDPYWEWWGTPAISATEDYKFGFYDNSTARWDQIAYEAPFYLIVKSAGNNRSDNGPLPGQPYFQRSSSGAFTLVNSRSQDISRNDGYDIIPTNGTAKNILTVGAVNPIASGYIQPSDVQISDFSSWGPTDDGRIKPDIVGNGVDVVSSVGASNTAYAQYSGTSMSSPNVAGSLLLLQEHYSNIMSGSVMRAATLKGLVIHTADEAGAAPGPDYIYGWGLLNMARAATVISDFKASSNPKHLLAERQLQNNEVYSFDVIASGEGPLVVTISWTDPEASPVISNLINNRTPRLVNDLDLRISNNGTTTYLPWSMNPAQPTAAATPGDNILDNVEQVVVANAIPGETYKVEIRHKGTLVRGPQAYSIVASGIGGTAYCTSAPTSDQGARIESVTIDGTKISPSRTAGCTTYSNFTESLFTLESGQTRTIAITPATCTTNASKIAKVFIDWNGNGSFTDANEQVAVSGIVTDNTTITAAIKAPASAKTGSKVRMRIVLSETTDAASVSSCGAYANGETQDYVVQLSKAAKDIETTLVSTAGETICASSEQAIIVKIRNNGILPLSNIPVKVIVRKNGTEISQLTTVYKGTINPSREAELTLTSFATEAGASYELEAVTTLQDDSQVANNTTSASFTVPNPEPAPAASVFRCGDTPNYSLTGTGNGTIYWYTSATATNPVAAGNQLQLPKESIGTKMFAALNDLSASVGYKQKSDLPYGGYNEFTPDVTVKAYAPMILESARLYIGHSGKITFTVYNQDNVQVSERTLQVTATRSYPAKGVQPNDPMDKGQVYYLGLMLPEAGDYRIAISYAEDATIYRNNQANIAYPIGIPNVFMITGNTAGTDSNTYYYYFYDLKVKALGCKSERTEVQVRGTEPLAQPVISRDGLKLRSTAAVGNQWYLNGTAIVGANTQEFSPQETGEYAVEIQKDGCVSDRSTAYTFHYKSEKTVLGKEFVVSPNPSTGLFIIEGELALDDVVTFTVYDMLGKTMRKGSIDNYNGQYEGQIDLTSAASGIYLLRIQKNNEVIVKRMVVQH